MEISESDFFRLKDKHLTNFLRRKEKEMNIERMARAQEYKRQEMLARIEEDNLRSQKIKEERAEIMRSRELLRQQIDRDKQRLMKDFEQMKQGKMDADEVANKYGYTFKNKSEAGDDHLRQSMNSNQTAKKKPKIYKPSSRLCKLLSEFLLEKE